MADWVESLFECNINLGTPTLLKLFLSDISGPQKDEDQLTVDQEHAPEVEDIFSSLSSKFGCGETCFNCIEYHRYQSIYL